MNLAADDRVSLTIDHDTPDVMAITGLSMAAHATPVTDRAEAEKVLQMLPLKYPDAPPLPMEMPTPDEVRLFRVEPVVISVLDYSKGFATSSRSLSRTQPLSSPAHRRRRRVFQHNRARADMLIARRQRIRRQAPRPAHWCIRTAQA